MRKKTAAFLKFRRFLPKSTRQTHSLYRCVLTFSDVGGSTNGQEKHANLVLYRSDDDFRPFFAASRIVPPQSAVRNSTYAESAGRSANETRGTPDEKPSNIAPSAPIPTVRNLQLCKKSGIPAESDGAGIVGIAMYRPTKEPP